MAAFATLDPPKWATQEHCRRTRDRALKIALSLPNRHDPTHRRVRGRLKGRSGSAWALESSAPSTAAAAYHTSILVSPSETDDWRMNETWKRARSPLSGARGWGKVDAESSPARVCHNPKQWDGSVYIRRTRLTLGSFKSQRGPIERAGQWENRWLHSQMS